MRSFTQIAVRPLRVKWLKKANIVTPQTEFGLGGVISSAAIGFPSHRSLFTVMYFIASLEYQVAFPVKTTSSIATESELFAFLGLGFVQIFGRIIIRY